MISQDMMQNTDKIIEEEEAPLTPAGTDLVGDTNVGYTPTGFTKINSSPLFFVRSGLVDDTTLYDFTWDGSYWSGSAQSSSTAYYLYFYSGSLYPAGVNTRDLGWSVRCVAR